MCQESIWIEWINEDRIGMRIVFFDFIITWEHQPTQFNIDWKRPWIVRETFCSLTNKHRTLSLWIESNSICDVPYSWNTRNDQKLLTIFRTRRFFASSNAFSRMAIILIRLFGSVWNKICFFWRAHAVDAVPLVVCSSIDAKQLLYSLMDSVSKYNLIEMNGMACVYRHRDETRASRRHSRSRNRNSCTPNWFNRFFIASRLLVTNCQMIDICSGVNTFAVASLKSFSPI